MPTPPTPDGALSSAAADEQNPSSPTEAPLKPPPQSRLSGASLVCFLLAGLSLIAAFSRPEALFSVALFGGYGYHLYRGGRDVTAVMADGRTRERVWLVWAGCACLALLVGFSWAPAFALAAIAGAYAAHLFFGGRDVVRRGADGTRRSAVWMYWAVIAVVATILGFAHPAAFVVALVASAYATYLFRGGRWVLWFW